MIRNTSTVLASDPMCRESRTPGVIGRLDEGQDVFADYSGGRDGTWDAMKFNYIGDIMVSLDRAVI